MSIALICNKDAEKQFPASQLAVCTSLFSLFSCSFGIFWNWYIMHMLKRWVTSCLQAFSLRFLYCRMAKKLQICANKPIASITYLFSSENIEKLREARVGKNIKNQRTIVECSRVEKYNKDIFYFERMEDKHESSFPPPPISKRIQAPKIPFWPFWVYSEEKVEVGRRKIRE